MHSSIFLAPPARGNFVGVKCAQQVYESGRGDKTRAVVAQGARDIRADSFEESREIIKNALRGRGFAAERSVTAGTMISGAGVSFKLT
jgi:hypothetical protein